MEPQSNCLFSLTMIFLLGYLLGSIPWGLIIGFINGVDIRTKGSKNIGSTNVTRVVGGGWGKACFLLDFLKGYLGVVLAIWLAARLGYGNPGLAKIFGGAGAVIGHVYPVWLRFKGGKGVATGAGVAFGLAFWPVIIGLITWVLVFKSTRIVAKASIAAACTVATVAFVFQVTGWETIGWPVVALIFAIAVIIVYRHKENIQRMLAGKENTFKK